MPYIIAESEPGGMEHEYFADKNTFLESVKKHRYATDKDVTDAQFFIKTSRIGDWMVYNKGIFMKVRGPFNKE